MRITLNDKKELVLHNQGLVKEYAVESGTWSILSHHYNTKQKEGNIPDPLGENIWRYCDIDLKR